MRDHFPSNTHHLSGYLRHCSRLELSYFLLSVSNDGIIFLFEFFEFHLSYISHFILLLLFSFIPLNVFPCFCFSLTFHSQNGNNFIYFILASCFFLRSEKKLYIFYINLYTYSQTMYNFILKYRPLLGGLQDKRIRTFNFHFHPLSIVSFLNIISRYLCSTIHYSVNCLIVPVAFRRLKYYC